MKLFRVSSVLSLAILFIFGFTPKSLLAEAILKQSQALGDILPFWTIFPFILLLLSIAILPLVFPHWWEHNRNRAIVSALLSLPFAAYLIFVYGSTGFHELIHALKDYTSFMTFLGALFIISGGIYIKGSLAGTPLSNTVLLGIGAVLSNFIGTTGASMILIRPILRANEMRLRKVHIVIFFIFIVSNCGGLLTPLGDPPLFLGFLKGVPFEWTLRLWKEWLLVNGLLLIFFNFFDQYTLSKEEKERHGPQLKSLMKHQPLRIEGWHNSFFLLGIIFVILAKGYGWGMSGNDWPFGFQQVLMLGLTLTAYLTTRTSTRQANRFTFSPIIEVAILFAGIFVTMIAPVLILNEQGKELGLSKPWHFFWATGILSSFLDNAPTYLTFAATVCGKFGVSVEGSKYLAEFLTKGPEAFALLTAISCGAVFMVANTYICNGPNFMVKAIAEENGIKMPSFLGYMAYSGLILIPIFILVTAMFFL
jgi:Na+/H+ antiporter NhaD/arsenite permease-like protein